MGATASSPDNNEVGDEVFRFAEVCLQIDDNDKLEKITGMVLNSVDYDKNKIYRLLINDKGELESRIRECARAIDRCSDVNTSPVVKDICENIPSRTENEHSKRREELISHFQRLYPSLDSSMVADELLRLNEKELNLVLSTPTELKAFIKSCTVDDEKDDVRNGPTSSILDSPEQFEKLKQEHLEQLSKPELCEEDVKSLIGNHLYNKITLLHPSEATLLTGILMEIERDMVLQLLASSSMLHLTVSSVIKDLIESNKLSKRSLTLMQEELGDVVYSVLEKDMDQDTACRVTGMLLEIDLVSLHEVLADKFLFRKRVKEALNACKLKS